MVESPQSFRFGGFTLDTARGVLLGQNGEIRLRPKTYRVLVHLLRHHGRLISRDELIEAAWGKAAITDDSLTQCMVEIRRALGDETRCMVRTVPRRGYMFEGPVTVVRSQQHGEEGVGDEPSMPSDLLGVRAAPARWPRAAAAVVLVFFVIGLAVVPAWRGAVQHDAPAPERFTSAVETLPNSIAVLPFVDLSAARDKDHLGEGFAEEILNSLAQIEGLKVIARTSSFSFRDPSVDIREIAERLGVTYVLEGSVRRSGNRVRVIAQLIDARDSTHLWSKDFDRELDDILAVQEEIAGNIAGVLDVSSAYEPGASNERYDVEAYEHFLRGRYLFHRRAPGDVDRARMQFERAVEIDPDYAAAWAALGGTWIVEIGVDEPLEHPAFAPARRAVARALELDPRSVEAHLRAAMLDRMADDMIAASRHVSIAEKLDPENLLLLGLKAGQALAEGDLATAIELQQLAVSRDPLSVLNRFNLAVGLLAAGRVEEGRAQIHVVSELSDDSRQDVDLYLAEAFVVEGRYREGAELLQDLPESRTRDVALAIAATALGRAAEVQLAIERLHAGGTFNSAVALAEVHAGIGDLDTAWRWLEESQQLIENDSANARRKWRLRLWSSLYLGALREEPRWAALVEGTTQLGANRD